MNAQKKNTQLTHSLILLVTAIIWGTSFVAQSSGLQTVGPLIYNCIRMFLGGLVLIPIIYIRNRIETATNWFSYNGLKKYLSDTIGIKLPYLKDLILFKKTGSREIYVIKECKRVK